MGISHKGHGRKSDKETQSPMLKIFKDIMQKEKTDPEKINLLKDKQREKKRKSYSESRSKTDHRSYDSSSTDRYKTNKQAKITVQDVQEERNENRSQDRSRSTAFRDDRKESWWFWGENRPEDEKKPEDTCSCVSCALKKIVSSEYTCIACLLILFSVSVVVAFLLIFKTMPVTDEVTEKSNSRENLAEKIQMLRKRQLTESYGYDFTEKNKWSDSLINSVGSYSNILGPEYPANEFKESNIADDGDMGMSDDLASILDNEKVMESQNSERLKDFFKKLIQTDAQIKKLKQTIDNNYQIGNFNRLTDRFKRSIKNKRDHIFKWRRENKFLSHNRNQIRKEKIPIKEKDKRSVTIDNSGLTGYVIEAEKLLIQYEPDKKRNFPKCSHVQETKSHEKHLKHPFYKHSQRVDEMLNTNTKSEKTNENDTVDDLFIVENLKIKNTDPKPKSKDHDRSLKTIKLRNEDTDNINSVIDITESMLSDSSSDSDYNIDKIASTTPMYDVALSVSTFINPMEITMIKSKLPRNKYPGQRGLMQIDEEEDQEEVGYEDLKEVLTDDKEGHDDLDRHTDRRKRNNEEQFDEPKNIYENKQNPPNINNPNWKGPMPLYPDELNTIIKQAALQNFNFQIPIITKDTKLERDKDEKDISDTQYVEDYTDNKYDNMVRMAQAYSDYGVLYSKKDNPNDKDKGIKSEQNSKFYKIFNKHRLFGRPKKGSSSEGFRLEVKPGSIPNEHEELYQAIQKHVKITKHPTHGAHSTTLHPINPEYGKIFSSTSGEDINSDSPKSTNTGNSIIFTIRKGSRALQSIDMTQESNNTINERDIPLHDSKINTTNRQKGHDAADSVISFISMMSDWFKTMASLSGEIKTDSFEDFKRHDSISNVTKSKSKNKYLEENNTKEIFYPSYDSDMIDNIGHRSRVLLSFNDSSTIEDKQFMKESLLKPKGDAVIPVALVLADGINEEAKFNNLSNQKNKTIVKRSLEKNLVFWNDLYDDDEYGVQLDYLDNLRDKHSVKGVKNFIHKSKNWIQGKFRNVTRKLKNKLKKKKKFTTKKKTTKTTKATPKIVKTSKKPCNDTQDPCEGLKRHVRDTNPNEELDIKSSFAVLNANMKKICQEAAKAVQNTRNIEVREDNKEGAAATSLMQQLVQMMTDLVDFQVQQKTCAKLPSDLYNFLEWLTAPAESNPQVDELSPRSLDYAAVDDDMQRSEKSTEPNFYFSTSLTEDTHQEDRTECLGTIRAVQDLIQQYEGMSDEDKSKMTGVREYLENQLQYLNNKLTSLDATNLYKLYEKRELPRMRRGTFNKNFKIKLIPVNKENKDDKLKKSEEMGNAKSIQINLKRKQKRNLRDVYYKALEEAKKTTAKDLKESIDNI